MLEQAGPVQISNLFQISNLSYSATNDAPVKNCQALLLDNDSPVKKLQV